MALKINLPESRVQVSHTQNLFPGLELKCLNVGQEKALPCTEVVVLHFVAPFDGFFKTSGICMIVRKVFSVREGFGWAVAVRRATF